MPAARRSPRGTTGRVATGEFDGHRAHRFTVAESRWSLLDSLWRDVAFGPDQRLIGQPNPAPSWDGRTPLGIITWDPVTGGTARYASTGSTPVGHACLTDAPLTGGDDGTHVSLRVRDQSGAARYTLDAPGRVFAGDSAGNGFGPAPRGPQWTPDGRYLVFGVT